jgi:hypothetical protein
MIACGLASLRVLRIGVLGIRLFGELGLDCGGLLNHAGLATSLVPTRRKAQGWLSRSTCLSGPLCGNFLRHVNLSDPAKPILCPFS